MAADERRTSQVPVDADLDPAIRLAAGALRAGLTRVHPSFRFEESLSARLAASAARLRAGLPVGESGSVAVADNVAPFRGHSAAADATAAGAASSTAGASGAVPSTHIRATWPVAAFRHLPDKPARPPDTACTGVDEPGRTPHAPGLMNPDGHRTHRG